MLIDTHRILAFSSKKPTLDELNNSIAKAQTYYEGLYVDEGKQGAVMAEYYPKINYTVRHATIGGYYYYNFIGDSTRSAKLLYFIKHNGFNIQNDQHSFMWTQTTDINTENVDSAKNYHDCYTKLPKFKNLVPYRSKVCILGGLSVQTYLLLSRFDTFVPLVNTLIEFEKNGYVQKNDLEKYEKNFDRLGFGISMCSPFSCSKTASTIRTATFGQIALDLNLTKYADTTAFYLVHAQNKQGAIYTSYDKNAHFKDDKSSIYVVIDMFFNDKNAYHGAIYTNAETMNDALAFLMNYRCKVYNTGCFNNKNIASK